VPVTVEEQVVLLPPTRVVAGQATETAVMADVIVTVAVADLVGS
jgi:hypothetical protein